MGFEAKVIGGPGKPDVVVTGKLGTDSYAAVVEAKAWQANSAIGLGVNLASIDDHRGDHEADYALMVAPTFSGGKLVEHAKKNGVGMLTTGALVSVLKQHRLFPFTIAELRVLFKTHGLADRVKDELGQVHSRHNDYLKLTNTVLRIFDEDQQRRQGSSGPISSKAIHLLLLSRPQTEGRAAPEPKQIEHVIALLSSLVLEVLVPEAGGYVLTLSPHAAGKRLAAW